MFIHDFNCSWLEHPFFQRRMMLKSSRAINKIMKHGIRELYIDTKKGLDVPDAPKAETVESEIREEIATITAQTESRLGDITKIQPIPLKEEIKRAREVKYQARSYIENVLDNISQGVSTEIEQIAPVVDNMIESVSRNQNAMISLLKVKRRDEYTYLHSVSVGTLLIAFSKFLNLDQETIRQYGIGGMLHDVGKMRVPLRILNKPGRLTESEFKMMKMHATYSREILEQLKSLSPDAVAVAAQHHERYDGSGYPLGLKGDDIHPGGQLAAIVDVYDAISSERVYHSGLPPAQAVRKLYEWSKFHFNSELVQKFISFIGIYPIGSVVELETHLVGVVVSPNADTPVVRVVYDRKYDKTMQPRDIDLSRSIGLSNKIVRYVNPSDHNINVSAVLESDVYNSFMNA